MDQYAFAVSGIADIASGDSVGMATVDPARPLRLGAQPGFTGVFLGPAAQRALLQRWTDGQTHPHERLGGLLALLHAASNLKIRTLTLDDIDHQRQTVSLGKRPFPTPLDPTTWTALPACLLHRQTLSTPNTYLIVTAVTRTRSTPADSTYRTRHLVRAATTPSTCRQTRIAQLVTDLDPKLAAAAWACRTPAWCATSPITTGSNAAPACSR
ncbi:MAG: hypothetical protein WBR33_18445 [Pseudonocardiaceae bacterium]